LEEEKRNLQEDLLLRGVPEEECQRRITIYVHYGSIKVSGDKKRIFENTLVIYGFPSAMNVKPMIARFF